MLKDGQHGPHYNHQIALANCFIGPQSHEALKFKSRANERQIEVGTGIFLDPEFGKAAVHGGSRESIAKILSVNPDDISLMTNTSEGILTVRDGIGSSGVAVYYGSEYSDVRAKFVNRNEVSSEWNGIVVEGAKDSLGRALGFSLEEFDIALRENKVDLVVVSHVQFASGFEANIAELNRLCKSYGVPILVDVAQSFGVLPFSPKEWGIDAVVSPLWKWIGGSIGTAFLWTDPEFRKKLQIRGLSNTCLDGPYNWMPDFTNAELREDGIRLEPSTLPLEPWATTSQMLKEAVERGDVSLEVRRLHKVARDALGPDIQIFEPQFEGEARSFLALMLPEQLYGREIELIQSVNKSGLKVDITARAGFIRIAPHHFTSDEALTEACTRINSAFNQLLRS